MNQVPDAASLIIKGECCSFFYHTSSPKEPGNRVVFFNMIFSPGDDNVTLGTNKVFVSNQMISTCIAKPGKEKTYKIVPQIIKVTHAASRIIYIKILKII